MKHSPASRSVAGRLCRRDQRQGGCLWVTCAPSKRCTRRAAAGTSPRSWPDLGNRSSESTARCQRLSLGCSGGEGETTAASFFARLAAIELHRFTPKEFLEGDDAVVVLLDVEFTVRATAKRCAEE